MKANYLKVFHYLRGFERMNPRYMWAESLLIEGNFNVFWGLILDIYFWS
jgi:hypothetical protein